MIHITDHQNDLILATLDIGDFWGDKHKETIKNEETFDFIMQGKIPAAQYVSKRNRVIIPDEDGFYREFIIDENLNYNGNKEVYCFGSYVDIAKQKIVGPITREGETTQTAVTWALTDTEWSPGVLEFNGTHTLKIDNVTDGLGVLKQIASLFELEIRYRVEIDRNKVKARYVDMIKKQGTYRGKEILLGKDLIGVKRREKSADICTALLVSGPQKADGTRTTVRVYDEDALKRWGRKGRNLWGYFEPSLSEEEATVEKLTELGQSELSKRINTVVEYEADAVAIEHVFGYEHEKVRLGDTNRIIDTSFEPALYLESRVISVERSLSDKTQKKFTLGDFIEYAETDVKKIQFELNQKASDSRVAATEMAIIALMDYM